MKVSLKNKILLRCPIIYRGRQLGPQYNLMCFGFECGDGWFQILYNLSVSIENAALKLRADGVSDEMLPCVSQVKEKYGELRFYVHNLYGDMDQQIDEAEELSKTTCEMCGGIAKKKKIEGWHKTVCRECMYSKKSE